MFSSYLWPYQQLVRDCTICLPISNFCCTSKTVHRSTTWSSKGGCWVPRYDFVSTRRLVFKFACLLSCICMCIRLFGQWLTWIILLITESSNTLFNFLCSESKNFVICMHDCCMHATFIAWLCQKLHKRIALWWKCSLSNMLKALS